MKTRLHVILCTAILLLASAPAGWAQAAATPAHPKPSATAPSTKAGVATDWRKIQIPPLPAFHPAQPKRIEFSNGMVVFLMEDHELPLITGFARIRGGARLEPAAKVGLVEVYADVWRTGGTENKTGDELDDFLEARAAKVETQSGLDSTMIGFDCLKADFNDVFGIFNDLLRHPAFRTEKIELAKYQLRTAISRRNDSSDEIAHRELRFLAYGRENPYARIPEYATVDAINRDDLVNWHQQFVTPNNMILGITGDFDSAQMESMLHKTFDDWPKGTNVAEPEILFSPATPGIYVVDKQDVNQSEVRIVGLGIRRDNPDYFASQVMNEVFGGGFSSRLFTNLRTKRGLAYSVGGGLGAAFDHPGIFYLTIGTKSATTVEALKGLREELDDLQKEPPTEIEMKRAKDSILNSFIFNFDTPEKVLRERMAYEFYGYPSDFLERYRVGVEKVTSADVLRVAKKYIHPEKLSTLIVGNTTEFEKSLSGLGAIHPLDITIPGNGAESHPAE